MPRGGNHGRTQLVAAAAVFICTAGATRALAQHHHHHAGGGEEREDLSALHGSAGLAVEVGRVDLFGEERDYQAVAAVGQVRWQAIELAVHVPFYRVELGGAWGEGLGDIHAEGRWIALGRAGAEAGLSFAIMPPVGSDDEGLAMGHWMIMTGAFGRIARGRLGASASVGYGSGLGGEGHAEHGGGVWPPVAPMNERELEASAEGHIALTRTISLGAGLAGAAPIGDGVVLATATATLGLQLGRFHVVAGVGHGLGGHPVGLRGLTHVMTTF